jgi:hypothetical protein
MPPKNVAGRPRAPTGTRPSSPFGDADSPRLTGSPDGYLAQRVEGAATGAGAHQRVPPRAAGSRPHAGWARRAAGRIAVTVNHVGTLVAVPRRMTAWTSASDQPGASLPMTRVKPSNGTGLRSASCTPSCLGRRCPALVAVGVAVEGYRQAAGGRHGGVGQTRKSRAAELGVVRISSGVLRNPHRTFAPSRGAGARLSLSVRVGR